MQLHVKKNVINNSVHFFSLQLKCMLLLYFFFIFILEEKYKKKKRKEGVSESEKCGVTCTKYKIKDFKLRLKKCQQFSCMCLCVFAIFHLLFNHFFYAASQHIIYFLWLFAWTSFSLSVSLSKSKITRKKKFNCFQT